MYTCYKLCYAIDKIQQYEKAFVHNNSTKIDVKDGRLEEKQETERKMNQLEVYNMDDNN